MGQALSCGNTERQQLCSAIRDGDAQYVETVAKEDPKLVNKSLFYNRLTPLHLAASHGHFDVLTALLERGAQPNATNKNGETPLMLACKDGRLGCIDILLTYGANVLAFDRANGRTCLHYAARGGHVECVRKILEAAQTGAVAASWGFERYVNVRDANGVTPLHLAAWGGHMSLVKHLLENGALVSATTTTTGNGPGNGSTPLHFAARSGSVESVRELLAWGADRCQRDLIGYTSYGIALKYKNIACAALLNPNMAEPLVWPSSWKFITDLDPQAKTLLETALAQANDQRERGKITIREVASSATGTETAGIGEEAESRDLGEVLEVSGSITEEMCCICFEQLCTIEVKECGHQMCATCTLALCCHNKPNPAIPHLPPPACPFCRRKIGQLIPAQPKCKESKSKLCGRSRRIASGKDSGGGGSFRKIVGRNVSKGSGRIADVEWLNLQSTLCQ